MAQISLPYAVWLIPENSYKTPLQDIIDELSARYQTPRFPAHITLCSGKTAITTEKLQKTVATFGGDHPVVTVRVNGLRQSDNFFHFFTIALDTESSIFAEAKRTFPDCHLPLIGPHLSLLYSTSRAILNLESIANELTRLLPQTIHCNTLALVVPAAGSWQDVDDWQILCSTGLAMP